MSLATILIVDDEKNILTTLSRALRVEDYDTDVAGSAEVARKKLTTQSYDAMLLDVMMPGLDGISFLRELRAEGVTMPVLVMSGHGTIETAVEATRLGAQDFLEKPISTERLLVSLARCLDLKRLQDENATLKRSVGVDSPLLGESPAMVQLRERIALVADAKASVLILGERGTGKELVARAIHDQGPRAAASLEKLNCAAVPKELVESELFGHEPGAFTGAAKQRKGKFERAHRGTLFLDEVGDMPSAMQAKLLRVLQEGEIERVGGSKTLSVDVRVVAATNRDLSEAMDEGAFRRDLYDRLNVLPLEIPPLRERTGDVPLLAEMFLRVACENNGRAPKRFTDGALAFLSSYAYPGNVRELRNLIERVVILTPGEVVEEADARALFPSQSGRGSSAYRPGVPFRELVEEVERDLLTRALEHHQGHMTKTAADLGLERSHLYKKLKALGLR